MTDLIVPIIFMLVMVVGEGLLLKLHRKLNVNWHDIAFNLNSGHIMLWLFRGLEIFCFGLVASHFSLGWVDSWPPALVWLFTLLAWDFGFYWLHRLHHTWGLFWAVHIVHHQGEHYNLSLGVRNSWYSSLTSIPFFMLLAIIGVPLHIFITVSIIHYTIQFFNHSALIPKLGWLETFMVTPSHHRVHHVKQGNYSNKNFSGSFIFWDKMFGTFEPSLPEDDFSYGIGGEKSSFNPMMASNLPFLSHLRLRKTKITHAAVQRSSSLCIMSGTLMLFALVIGYVFDYGYGYNQFSVPQYALFLLLAGGTLALAELSQGRRRGIVLWLAIAVALPLLFLYYWQWSAYYWVAMMTLLLVHAMAVAIGWGFNKTEESVTSDNEVSS